MSGSAERGIQEKILKLNQLQEDLETQQSQLEETINRLQEINSTLMALEELSMEEKEKFTGFVKLGSNTFVKGKVKLEKDKILQDIGAGVSLSLTMEKTQKRLKKRQKEIREKVQAQQKELSKLQKEIQELRTEIREIQQQYQQYQRGGGIF